MPAAAVIPAPIAYIKVVAVKKLVVGFWIGLGGSVERCVLVGLVPGPGWCVWPLLVVRIGRDAYCEEIRVFKAGI